MLLLTIRLSPLIYTAEGLEPIKLRKVHKTQRETLVHKTATFCSNFESQYLQYYNYFFSVFFFSFIWYPLPRCVKRTMKFFYHKKVVKKCMNRGTSLGLQSIKRHFFYKHLQSILWIFLINCFIYKSPCPFNALLLLNEKRMIKLLLLISLLTYIYLITMAKNFFYKYSIWW